eukprot:Plantae.Rhodophyta-Purpureofilum_apyrenoidigerum.ctg10131.p1 GENE.Plantae.Rhodophyta-Purpureofilum_apyrenoidigerum.ctg10131~~Plantae.Rhodophyta-Purpureofilum_apyrenoidigerum.ctg10131.p1  ORF type:complete len:717 (+),score=165.17 Plantae.Rhodophyta-Purpureofilum_apyrenoidigerum.ctg10131:262-2412(+)
MDLGSIFNKAGETWKHLEKDFSKELGLSTARDEKEEISGWNDWQDDDWENVENDKSASQNNTEDAKSDAPSFKQPMTAAHPPSNLQDTVEPPLTQLPPEVDETVPLDQMLPDSHLEAVLRPDLPTAVPSESNTDSNVASAEEIGKLRTYIGMLERQNSQFKREFQLNAEKSATNDRKVRALTKECEALRRSRDSRNVDSQLLKEKQKQVEAVLEEGQQLSVKISEREQTIKQLKRTVEELRQEREGAFAGLNDSRSKVEALTAKLRQSEVNEKSLSDRCDLAEKRLRELEDQNRSTVGIAAALDVTRTELDVLKRSQSRVLEDTEYRLRVEAQSELETFKKQSVEREAKFNKKIAELNVHLTAVNNDAGMREDALRWELQEARKRCQMLEAQHQDLSAAVPEATRPLLRQIEALQGTLLERTSTIEAAERSQIEQLREAKNAVSIWHSRFSEAEKAMVALESKLNDKQERARQLETERNAALEELDGARASANEVESSYRQLQEELRSIEEKLKRQAERYEVALAEEKKTHVEVINLYDDREEGLRQKFRDSEKNLEEVKDSLRQAQRRIAALQAGPTSAPSSARSIGSHSDIESLSLDGMYGQERVQVALRQKSEEVQSLQEQLAIRDKSMKLVTDEVVKLTRELDEVRKDLGDSPQAKQELTDIRHRHDTLMVLYGERTERVQELEQDLKDINNMYKEQINDLLLQIEQLQRQK